MKRIFVTLCVTYSVLSLIYFSLPQGISKLLMIPITTSVIGVLGFYIRVVILSELNKHKKNYNKEMVERGKRKKREEECESKREYDTAIKPLYSQGRALFTKLVQQHKLRNYDIADLIKLINSRLGVHANHYHNWKFKNDIAEVYVKMKNFELNEYDWQMILNFLHERENNEIIKKTKEELA